MRLLYLQKNYWISGIRGILIHSLCRQIQVLNRQRLFLGCSDFEISLVAELAGWQTLQLVSDWRKCHYLSFMYSSIGPWNPKWKNDSLYTSHSCDRMISSVYLSLGNDAFAGRVPTTDAVSVFQILEQNSAWWSKECHDPNLQTAWSFSLSSGQENFFFQSNYVYSKPVFAGFLVISFISNQVDSALIYEFQVEMTF